MTPQAFEALERIYGDLEEELRRLRPVCRGSGECCRFPRAGHELWTTPLELEYLLLRDPAAERGWTGGGCPFLDSDRRCAVRDRRTLGCRIYYCDPAHQDRMGPLYERYFGRIKEAMRGHGIGYEYFRFLDRVRPRIRGGTRPQGDAGDTPRDFVK